MKPIEERINKALAESKKGLFNNINKRKKAGKSRSKKTAPLTKKHTGRCAIGNCAN